MASFITAGNATNGLQVSSDNTGILELRTGTGSGTTAVTVNASQNVGIGTSSPSSRLDVRTSAAEIGRFSSSATNGGYQIFYPDNVTTPVYVGSQKAILGTGNATDFAIVGTGVNNMVFGTGSTERARIDSSGNWLVGTTDAGLTTGVGFKFNPSATTPTSGVVVNSATGTSSHIHLFNTNATNNGYRFYVVSNGGVYNFSGNNSNLSDLRVKTNIELSGSYLDKICAIPVKLFNYKDEAEGEQRTLGVIAQDVEAVAPELVNNDGFGEPPEGGSPLKSIYTTDMMFAMMKAIQEQQQMIETLQAKVAALEGA